MKKKNKQSICFLLPGWVTKHTGGAELQTYLISEEFIKRDWSVEVVTSSSYSTDFHKEFYNEKVKYYYYKREGGIYSSLLIQFFSILFILFGTKSNIYYNRTDARILRAACGLYCKICGKKMVYAIASDEELIMNKYTGTINTNLTIKNLLKYVDRRFSDMLVQLFSYSSKITICQTEYQKKMYKTNFDGEVQLIRNSYSFNFLNENKKENIILWISNFRKVKQPELFLNIYEEIKNNEYKFVMIGNYKSYSSSFIELCKDKIDLLGELSYSETELWFSKSKIFVNTSIQEGFPNTFIQAWLNRVLILSYQVDPDSLLIQHGLGFCAKGDFLHFTDILNKIINNYTDYNNTLEKAYSFALDEFNLKKNTDLLERELQCII
jgi:glycosyltransferase involved in cell wall biosynthesis